MEGKREDWIDSVKAIGCNQLEWPCPYEREGHKNATKETHNHDHEAACEALKILVKQGGKILFFSKA